MSNNIIQFGMYEGQTFEWIFFHHPHYARYIKWKGIPSRDYFGEAEGDYFHELYHRVCNLGGTCPTCKAGAIEYLTLTFHGDDDQLGYIGLCCGECDYLGGSDVSYPAASFFPRGLLRTELRRVTKEIKRHYIGHGNLTQAKTEEFFYNDANFSECTAGFFAAAARG